jgi:hypothetical protein
MKLKLSIFITNWINLATALIACYLFNVIKELVVNPINSNTLMLAFLGSLFLLFLGALIIVGYLIVCFLLEMLFLGRDENKLTIFLVVEWAIISTPFIYYASLYEAQRYIYIVGVIALLISQLFFRKRKIIYLLK